MDRHPLSGPRRGRGSSRPNRGALWSPLDFLHSEFLLAFQYDPTTSEPVAITVEYEDEVIALVEGAAFEEIRQLVDRTDAEFLEANLSESATLDRCYRILAKEMKRLRIPRPRL